MSAMNCKRCILISTLLFNVLSVAGFSQSVSVPNQWETSFTSENLTPSDVDAFETRAIQKVKDFYNYLNIICNPQYDIQLRNAAKSQALDMFYSKESTVDGVKLESVLDSCVKSGKQATWQILQASTEKVLILNKDHSGYDGSISFNLVVNSGAFTDKEVSIVLCKKAKKFGSDTKMVWTVLLNEIK